MRGWWLKIFCVVGCLVAGAASADTGANVPASVNSATPSGPLKQTALKPANNGAAVKSSASGSGAWEYARVPVALGGVVLLILAMRWMAKGLAGVNNGKGALAGVQV